MKFWKRTVILMLAISTLLTFAACGDGGQTKPPADPPENDDPSSAEGAEGVLDKSKSYSVLFIGNSYTYYNDMPEKYFAKIMASAGYTVTVKSLTKGSQYLAKSADPNDELGAKVDAELKANKYDFVVLQDQSTCALLRPQVFSEGVHAMVEKVRANGATPLFYSTWGSKEGRHTLAENGWTTETMMWQIAEAYERMGAELDVGVAHVGMAFFDVHTHQADIDLYNPDLSHPSVLGSFLAALTIFARITGVDPTAVTYKSTIPVTTADILKTAAKKAVFETPDIPAEYQHQ